MGERSPVMQFVVTVDDQDVAYHTSFVDAARELHAAVVGRTSEGGQKRRRVVLDECSLTLLANGDMLTLCYEDVCTLLERLGLLEAGEWCDRKRICSRTVLQAFYAKKG